MTIDASRDGRRAAPPAMVVALAVGLGSVDMPVPAVAEWEWLNWRFPRQIHAGDTIYAHWVLTQKRPPASGSSASIVVWRVDIHTADGALCAEGEVGAKVTRSQAPQRPPAPTPAPARGGRRRRRPRANGSQAAPETPPAVAQPAAAAVAERSPGSSRRRRRRRSPGAAAREGEHETRAAPPTESTPPDPPAAAPAAPATAGRKGLGGVLRRLRGT